MKLMIDTNILIDVLQCRDPYVTESSLIWKICETKIAEGYVSVLTFADIVYIMRKEMDPEGIEKVLQSLMLIFKFIDLTSSDLSAAAQLRMDDFEDALQAIAAKRMDVDLIVTRNKKDFANSGIPVCTPNELISEL